MVPVHDKAQLAGHFCWASVSRSVVKPPYRSSCSRVRFFMGFQCICQTILSGENLEYLGTYLEYHIVSYLRIILFYWLNHLKWPLGAPLGPPWGPLGAPLGPLGSPWGPRGLSHINPSWSSNHPILHLFGWMIMAALTVGGSRTK